MPHYTQYKCSECEREFPNGTGLVRKKIDFQEIGAGGRTIRSRVKAWLCKDKCMPADPDFNLPAFRAPGSQSPALERVRKAQSRGDQ